MPVPNLSTTSSDPVSTPVRPFSHTWSVMSTAHPKKTDLTQDSSHLLWPPVKMRQSVWVPRCTRIPE